MRENCYDIGTIQAFLDGELASETTETVARHVSVCEDCAILMANAEDETAFAFSVLEQEINTLVPTQRLWTKINDSIAREKQSFWKPIFAFLLQPSTAAFAGLLFVAAVSITFLSLKPDAPTVDVAQNSIEKPIVSQSVSKNEQLPVVQVPPAKSAEKNVEAVKSRRSKNEFRAMKTSYVKPEINRTTSTESLKKSDTANRAPRENVSGEESYLKTIMTLAATVDNRKDEVLSPSARFVFERDLAVTDDAIIQMRKEVRKNPSNEAAKQILRASYQNKIDLLNSLADKTELMASLK